MPEPLYFVELHLARSQGNLCARGDAEAGLENFGRAQNDFGHARMLRAAEQGINRVCATLRVHFSVGARRRKSPIIASAMPSKCVQRAGSLRNPSGTHSVL